VARSRLREPLTRDRVLQAAMALADRDGIEALTMRSLARELGVEAMSLYHHVANKDALLDGMVDLVFGEFELPQVAQEWRTAMRRRAISAREALNRHRWAIALVDSRSAPGPNTLRHLDAVIGCLRANDFSLELTAHAFALLDNYVYGFALQESALPFSSSDELDALADQIMSEAVTAAYRNFAEFVTGYVLRPGYAFGNEFEFGLELILDGLERLRSA
jgi:AcrR family transcriptional regulator